MKRVVLSFVLLATAAFGQYKMEPVAGAPSGLAPAFASLMQPQGYKVLNAGGSVVCEVWFRTAAPGGPKSAEDAVALPTIPQGALLGVIQFPANGADRRGQTIKPGLYTLRYSLFPVNGDHQGVAPQRDFVLLVPAAEDKDANAMPGYDPLVALSRKASGTPHPAVLSISSSTSDKFPNFTKEGDHDWTLHIKIGELPVSIILVGKAEG